MAVFSHPDISSVEIDDSAVIDYIKTRYSPEDIFPEKELEEWAESNGFIDEEE